MRSFARDELAPLGGSRGPDDGHPRGSGQLHCRGADDAASTVNEHGLSRLSMGARKESAMRCAIGNRDRRTFGKGNVIG